MKSLFHIIMLFVLILSVSCNQIKEKTIKINEDSSGYFFRYYDSDTGQIIRLTEKQMQEIQNAIPYLNVDSCKIYNPDSLYALCLLSCEEQLDINGFTSEAGQDEFYKIYSMVLRKEVDKKFVDSDTLRIALQNIFNSVNSTFQCVSQGGTMYYHMSERIYGYAEWYLLTGINDNYKSLNIVKYGDIEKQISDICITYKENISKEQINSCMQNITVSNKEYKNWLLEQAFDFTGLYK
ncbi:MAG: hypothetical protein HY951_07285 [Bacteroidia bacterium]|nr:hypothetical protein [Bacteroidia bacterium]